MSGDAIKRREENLIVTCLNEVPFYSHMLRAGVDFLKIWNSKPFKVKEFYAILQMDTASAKRNCFHGILKLSNVWATLRGRIGFLINKEANICLSCLLLLAV